MSELLKSIDASAAGVRRAAAVDPDAARAAGEILADVSRRGAAAVREHAERLGDLAPGGRLIIDRSELERARDALPAEERGVLERAHARIRSFAEAQRASVLGLDVMVEGGRAGHRVTPVESAGCYVPGGRFPLPSSALMTVATARAAGVGRVVAASPRPSVHTLAAAAIAGADALLAVGGAQAIGAMAYGLGGDESFGPCAVICGPGNKYVTAAKKLVAGEVRIDMLAGPSELVICADESAEADVVAADLLAQAEHDADASAILVTTHAALVGAVNAALERRLRTLPTERTARAALANGFAVVVGSMDEAVGVCDRIGPEHLQVIARDAGAVAPKFGVYGSLFVGRATAEAFGDYGAGPNHTLPTGGSAGSFGGLSVMNFLVWRTWLRVEEAGRLVRDTAALARMEGLEAHARSAEARASG